MIGASKCIAKWRAQYIEKCTLRSEGGKGTPRTGPPSLPYIIVGAGKYYSFADEGLLQ
jgi:hypothetical protein